MAWKLGALRPVVAVVAVMGQEVGVGGVIAGRFGATCTRGGQSPLRNGGGWLRPELMLYSHWRPPRAEAATPPQGGIWKTVAPLRGTVLGLGLSHHPLSADLSGAGAQQSEAWVRGHAPCLWGRGVCTCGCARV